MPLQQERKKAGAVLAKKKKFRYSTSILSDHALIDIAGQALRDFSARHKIVSKTIIMSLILPLIG